MIVIEQVQPGGRIWATSSVASASSSHFSTNRAPETLTEGERIEYEMILNTVMNAWQQAFYLRQDGALPDEVWDQVQKALMLATDMLGFRSAWEKVRLYCSVGIQKHVEGLLVQRTDSVPGGDDRVNAPAGATPGVWP